MSYQVLARKWRPHTFQEMVGQEPILRMLTNALDTQRLHHAYLFTGTRGIGKTTLARIFSKCLNCENGITSQPCGTCKICTAIDAGRFLDLFEIDAASRTKVEDTRELLDNVPYPPVQGRYKIYLIDEVHMLSGHSFNALLKTLEEPPPYVKFLLATTDPKKLPITILSRCLQFNLKCISPEKIAQHLEFICKTENIAYEVPALQLLAQAADGSVRDALSLLDQAIAFCSNQITIEPVRQMLGSIDHDILCRLLQALANQEGKKLLEEIALLAEQTPDFNQTLEELLSLLHQISVAQIIPDATDFSQSIKQLASSLNPEDVQLYYQIALIGRRDLALAPHPQYGFEMVMLRMLAFKPGATDQPVVENKITSSVQLAATPASPATQQKKPLPPVNSVMPWTDILPKLALSGMAYALASNCTLEQIAEDKILLTLSQQHEPMFNKKLEERIEQALQRYFNKPMKLMIQMTAAEIHTPAKQNEQNKAAKQAMAADTIQNDGQVKKILDMFGATVDPHSIQPIE